jgi:8-oxo-dGTP pyrophosphatase MutT (NUDIX family)
MADAETVVVEATPASTVLMVRDGVQGLEVFMVVRHRKIDFAGGALVFPGGKIDPEDSGPALIARCAKVDGLDTAAMALRVGAIRETFEEAGVAGTDFDAISAKYRGDLNGSKIGMIEIVEAEDLELACDLLVPFAHWITPVQVRRRFDTHFFIIPAPVAQAALHDGSESVESVWIRPADAVAEAEAGERSVMFPTRLNLNKVDRGVTVAGVLANAAAEPVVTVLPQAERLESGERRMKIPLEAGYGASEFVVGYSGA